MVEKRRGGEANTEFYFWGTGGKEEVRCKR